MNKNTIILLISIVALASFLRLWDLKNLPPGLYPDEAMNGNNALEATATGNYKMFYPENNGREGLFINLQAMSLKIFGNEPWALRLIAALFGILTVLGTFFLARELFKRDRLALLAAFFIATSFWHINFSRIGFRAIMAPFFLTWSLYFLWNAINDRQNDKPKSAWDALKSAFGGILFGFGFHSYISYRVAPALLALPFFKILQKRGEKCSMCQLAIFILFALIAAAPLGIYFLENPADFLGRTSQLSIFSTDAPLQQLGLNIVKTAGMFWIAGDYNWRHNLSGTPELWWPIGILFIIGIITAIRALVANYKSYLNYWLLFLWIAIGLLPVIISNEGIPHALRAIIVIPPVLILAAVGAEKLLDYLAVKWTNRQIAILLSVFIIAVAAQSYIQYFKRWGQNENTFYAFSENYANLGHRLASEPREIPKYIVANASGDDVRGVPMPAQTVMFLTDTFRTFEQAAKNLYYVLPQNLAQISCDATCVIALLEYDSSIISALQKQIPELHVDIGQGFVILQK